MKDITYNYVSSIDVSHWQGIINWTAVASAGIQEPFAKATQGISYVDPQFAQNWRGMKSAGFKYKGAYHYLEPDGNCTEQAKFFYTTILSIDPDFSFDTDFLALDVEEPNSGSAKDYQKCLSDFLEWLPVTFIYTSQPFFDSICSSTDCCLSTVFYFDCTSLWVVDYQSVSIPKLPYCWGMTGGCYGWDRWQYTDKGNVSGINGFVDLNWLNSFEEHAFLQHNSYSPSNSTLLGSSNMILESQFQSQKFLAGALILGLAGLGILLYKKGNDLYQSTQKYWHLVSGWCTKNFPATRDSATDMPKKQSSNYFSFLNTPFCFKKSDQINNDHFNDHSLQP